VKISCPSCSAKYSISDEKVVSRLAKIRCRKCGATIVIDGKVNPPTVTATAGGAGDAGEDHAVQEHTDTGGPEYSVDLGEGDQRTMPLSDIVVAYNAGQITGETFIWADGFSDWKALSEVQEIVDALHAAAGGGQPASSPAAASSPWDAKAAAPQPSPVRAAARPARAAAGDLFGRIDRAGSEEDVATSAPDPSGLGGGGGGGGTGARNESSVLFSLSALTSASAPNNKSVPSPSRSSAGSSTTASRDDSGLIDLKALTAAAVKSDGAAPPALASPALSPLTASPLGVASPLGLGSPLGGGLVSGDLGAPQKGKTGLFIAIAIVAAAVIVAVVVILKPAPPPPAVAAPLPPPPPTAAPAPTPTPTLAAAPPPTGSAETEAEAPTTKKTSTTYRRPSGGTAAKKPSSGSTGGSEPAAAPAKPKSKCGCASGDLQCAMRCAAKGG
jgi:predicted Zn finger-like uncharacterized protein